MICPECMAEYREGFTVCADCDVPLVAQLPALSLRSSSNRPSGSAEPASSERTPDDLEEDPFCEFWQGDDSSIHAELCTVLSEAGIPYKTVRREQLLFRLSAKSALKIGVPFSLYQKAEVAVQQAFGTGEEGASGIPLLAAPSAENEDVSGEDDPSAQVTRASADFDPSTFFPDDATAEIWVGDDAYTAEFLVAALRANEIHCRWDEDGNRQKLFVLPNDQVRAREIVREVVEASPPPD
jgi:hypothetical protein